MKALGRIDIVSGYFAPLHIGHIRLFQAARKSFLVVIVNNDAQQLKKIGQVYMPAEQRLEIIQNIRLVDHAMIALDSDPGVGVTLRAVREMFPAQEIHFHNGGDRSARNRVPPSEARACDEARITMHFDTGGSEKMDTSTRMRGGVIPPPDAVQ